MTQRTQDSLVCGVPARELRYATVLCWERQQELMFVDYIMDHLDFVERFRGFQELLKHLGVNGFKDIKNDQGESVHMIIVKNVQDKITSLRAIAGLRNRAIVNSRGMDHEAFVRRISRDLYEERLRNNTRANAGGNAEGDAEEDAGENQSLMGTLGTYLRLLASLV
ncbi:hypothetical protein F5B22DRAFT_360398 [Xylaria bambusicola]|uniref:uncharacterized protein n=1 Tax=Xylaria bambusicola TaxID=326684 RepID=UPI00200870B8|nr:uncharacterized protein F5B22DRAFT_360398 [Xylaria bambusicola]KAI0509315.1 hypothetical protein F5B22DRAFT_360398 [Xylaria bambusicola]